MAQWELGDITVYRVLEYEGPIVPPSFLYPTSTEAAVESHRHWLEPRLLDPDTGFISRKSKDGKELKALELPGLWNGSMADWNTIFVEVPAITFNPVKTINDLLKKEHQPAEN